MADITMDFVKSALPNKPHNSLCNAMTQHTISMDIKPAILANHRIVICLAIWVPLLPTPPSRDAEALTPALRSNTFQNLRLSSAAKKKGQGQYIVLARNVMNGKYSPAVASICPSGLRQLCNTLVSWAGISTFRTRVG
jgi:hypothetical protein